MHKVLAVAIVSLGLAAPVHAATIFSTLGAGDSYECCSGWAVFGPAAPIDTDRGVPFVPLGAYTLDSVEAAFTWLGGTNAGDIWLMSDSGGLPGVILESFHFDNLPTFSTSSTALVTGASTLHPLLSAGTQYWLVASANDDSFLSLNFNNTNDTGLASRDDALPWGFDPDATAGAIRVSGTPAAVPEPATIVLFATGTLVLACFIHERTRI